MDSTRARLRFAPRWYISNAEVAKVFVKVNDRMRVVLKALDADPFYSAYKPSPLKVPGGEEISHDGWLGAYNYFMSMFLDSAQEKTQQFAYKCVYMITDQIDNDGSLSDDQKANMKAMLLANLQSGMWKNSVLSFGSGYADLMTKEWS